MTEEGAEAGNKRRVGRRIMRCEQNRGGALERIAQQGRGGEALAPGTQHVGRADIARADGADVGPAGRARQQQSERDRAEQIADGESERVSHTYS
jgi:hypothetical protein